jgi:hypothetical protein
MQTRRRNVRSWAFWCYTDVVAALVGALMLVLGTPMFDPGAIADATPSTYQVHLFNTDDVMNAYLTNSSPLSPQLVATSSFAVDDITADITAFVTPGSNELNFYLTNSGSGYTWGIQVFENNSILLDESICGSKGNVGCNNNDLTEFTNRLVHTFDFVVPSAVPEPTTMLMLGSGLIVVIGTSWKRHQRT